MLQAIATGQAAPSRTAAPPRELSAAPFIMRVRLNDEGVAEQLPAGSVGTAAIYTDHVRASDIIRQVILRQTAKIRNLEKAGYAGRGIVSSISLTLSIRRYEYLCLGAGTQSTSTPVDGETGKPPAVTRSLPVNGSLEARRTAAKLAFELLVAGAGSPLPLRS